MNRGHGRKLYGDAIEGGLRVHRSVKTRVEILDPSGKPQYTPRAWWKRRQTPGGPKVKGPQVWNVDSPDPSRQWTWVEEDEHRHGLDKFSII